MSTPCGGAPPPSTTPARSSVCVRPGASGVGAGGAGAVAAAGGAPLAAAVAQQVAVAGGGTAGGEALGIGTGQEVGRVGREGREGAVEDLVGGAWGRAVGAVLLVPVQQGGRGRPAQRVVDGGQGRGQ